MDKDKIIEFFKGLRFEEEEHIYLVDGKKLKKSVSNIVHNFKPVFKKHDISLAISYRDNIPQEEILKSWDDSAKQACNLGSRVHKFGELYPYDNSLTPSDKYEEAVVKFWDDIPEHIKLVFCEIIMYHTKLLYGGTADILFWDEKRKGYIIGDYKTNKDLFKNYKGQTLLKQFSNLLDTPFNGYQIQLSLYQILLEQVGIKVVDRILIWLKPNGSYEMYKTLDLTNKLKNYA